MMAALTTVLEWLKRILKLASRAWEYSGKHNAVAYMHCG